MKASRRAKASAWWQLAVGVAATVGCQRETTHVEPRGAEPWRAVAVLATDDNASFVLEGIEEGYAGVRWADGAFAFLDYRAKRIVVLDTTGREVRTIARGGGAPGELQFPQMLVRSRQGIGVVDGQKRALVTFDTTGRALGDLPLDTLLGVPPSLLTGLRQLTSGEWVYSVIEHSPGHRAEALYIRRGREAQLLARTPVATTRPIMMPCRVELPPEPPVFWPTIRWNASGTRVAFVTGADYHVVSWDAEGGDSVVYSLPLARLQASDSAALQLPIGYSVRTPMAECTLSARDALRQRGMAPERPLVAAVAVSPSGQVWTRLSVGSSGAITGYRHAGDRTDSLPTRGFPAIFESDSRYLSVERDREGGARLVLWQRQGASDGVPR
ncbi:MAG TPA: hypothetical protein PKC83_13410 [Gemmatimonadaceae bacterium]|mgnify:CR=1 FL=1|nr:MAG: hypothetical protein ABS52_13765 [Gemmatimonadetes bacterium SCN 70-22]HMN09773.1 hypothetical protein [Gemmatimonadaceae bacterium]